MKFRILGFFISMVALMLSLTWLGWKFTVVIWLAAWGNNLSMAAKLGYPDKKQAEVLLDDGFQGVDQEE